MIVLVGASASGKTEIAKILCKTYGYKKCITTTTRLKRENELADIDYHFISKQKFLKQKANDEFIEVTNYQDNFYGTHISDINKDGVVIVDPNGANALLSKLNCDIFVVYVESSEKLRRQRMISRGDNPKLVEKRIKADQSVFQLKKIKHIDLSLKNDHNSLDNLAALIHESYRSLLKNLD
jgi:guanylate kinase